MNSICGCWEKTASGASLPIEPVGSAPALLIGAMMRSMSSRLYPKARSRLS
ncbi:hypothetical protein Barb7_00821 [Bacteroidales bacterium Barb7]|nr:hypothetical protein Barb7_00821 [Bacteroidales bacterium Barb7]